MGFLERVDVGVELLSHVGGVRFAGAGLGFAVEVVEHLRFA